MKQFFSLVLVTISFSAFAETATPQLKDGLIGFSQCQTAGNDHFKGKIFLHEDFLKNEAYAILAGDLNEAGNKGSFAVFLVTNPDMDGKNFTLHFSRDGKKLGTLAIKNNGLTGKLTVDKDSIDCTPIP